MNLLLRVYFHNGGKCKEVDFGTFQDGHDEMAISEAILASPKSKRWVAAKY